MDRSGLWDPSLLAAGPHPVLQPRGRRFRRDKIDLEGEEGKRGVRRRSRAAVGVSALSSGRSKREELEGRRM